MLSTVGDKITPHVTVNYAALICLYLYFPLGRWRAHRGIYSFQHTLYAPLWQQVYKIFRDKIILCLDLLSMRTFLSKRSYFFFYLQRPGGIDGNSEVTSKRPTAHRCRTSTKWQRGVQEEAEMVIQKYQKLSWWQRENRFLLVYYFTF